jgi:hypothetical protein
VGTQSIPREYSEYPTRREGLTAVEMDSFMSTPPRSLTPHESSSCAIRSPSFGHDTCTARGLGVPGGSTRTTLREYSEYSM